MEREEYRRRIQADGSLGKNVVRKIVTRLNSEAERLRKDISEKNRRSMVFKEKKWKSQEVQGGDQLPFQTDQELMGYHSLSVFNGKYVEPDEDEVEKVNVIGDIELSENETNLLRNKPKLAVLGKLEEEVLERELEVAGI